MKDSKASEQISSLEHLQKTYDAYRANEDFKNAFFTLKKIDAIQEQLMQQQKKAKYAELERQYQPKQKDELLIQERKYNKALKEKNAELAKVLENQKTTELHLKSLQLQLSPHFIFNTLQSIQSVIFQQDAEKIGDSIAQFSNLMRSILGASQKSKVTILDEIELLETYLLLEQKRFEHRFSFDIVVLGTDKPGEVYLPSLLIQPFVENAILHGVGNQNDGDIVIIFKKETDFLYIHILDNGIGRAEAKKIDKSTHQGTSTALKILQERADTWSKSNSFNFRFRIKDRKKNNRIVGTQVIIQVNYLNPVK